MKPVLISASAKRASGFSLPEITMAVGIAAMAIVLLLGLLPSGMNSIQAASNTLAETRIYQQIIGEVQSANWGVTGGTAAATIPTALQIYDGAKRLFDDQGTPLPESGANNSMRVNYVARITLEPPGTTAVPGGQPSPNLLGVRIDVAAVPDPGFDFRGDVPFKTRTFVVSRQF